MPYLEHANVTVHKHANVTVHKIEGTLSFLRLACPTFKIRGKGARDNRRRRYYYDNNGLEWEIVEYLSDDPARRNEYI